MLKSWGSMSTWGKFCLVSSVIFLLIGVIWLIFDVFTSGLSFWSPARTFLIVGICLFLMMLSENETEA
ncbi:MULTISPECIES: hypothetical protein [Bacillaceae]|uniref:Uncharacterized protein n=1 Tax=Evansella alkalicola TaxID=745819 RepID=A0ABS6JUR0_9BACI|nr:MULTISPECIES: hypothetical protein [Bacillaceae]MBU9720870.1 hypothetical protein [Bacillus alkalicola]